MTQGYKRAEKKKLKKATDPIKGLSEDKVVIRKGLGKSSLIEGDNQKANPYLKRKIWACEVLKSVLSLRSLLQLLRRRVHHLKKDMLH